MIFKCNYELYFKRIAAHRIKRRTFLQQKQELKYARAINKFEKKKDSLFNGLNQVFLNLTRTDALLYDASIKFWMEQQKYNKQIFAIEKKIKSEYENKVGKLLDQSKCIAAIGKISESIIKLRERLIKFAKKEENSEDLKEDQELISLEVYTTRAKDYIFFEDGIEVEDIERTIRDLKLKKNEDYKKLIAKVAKKNAEFKAMLESI